jgi:hypothetical protein
MPAKILRVSKLLFDTFWAPVNANFQCFAKQNPDLRVRPVFVVSEQSLYYCNVEFTIVVEFSGQYFYQRTILQY